MREPFACSIDGLHSSDLSQWIALRPDSALATLAARGTLYPNTRSPIPSDSFPGVLSLVTGAVPTIKSGADTKRAVSEERSAIFCCCELYPSKMTTFWHG